MLLSCPGCGSGFTGDPLRAAWQCAHCGRTNPNEEFVKAQIAKIDFSKARSSADLGELHYGSGKYAEAMTNLEAAIVEHAGNASAWRFLAMSVAKSTNLPAFVASHAKVCACLEKARALDPDGEFGPVAEAICRNTLAAVAKRGLIQSTDDARRAWFAFESIDKNTAAKEAAHALSRAVQCADRLRHLPPEDPRIGLQVTGLYLIVHDEFESLLSLDGNLKRDMARLHAHFQAQLVKVGRTGQPGMPGMPPELPRKQTSKLLSGIIAVIAVVAVAFLLGIWFVVLNA